MGYLRRPDYYKNFKCISSKCTDSCCQEWEIDIDDDTLQFYMQVEGEFGDRLRKNIRIPAEIDTAHFIQTENERCPFLNDCGLCDIFINLGEEHLSQICTHHPRFYDWFLDGEEAGLGLCCEEAARFILQESGYPKFEIIQENSMPDSSDDAWNMENQEDKDVIFQKEMEQMLFDMREQLFAIIKPETDIRLDDKTERLYEMAVRFQNKYDDVMFPVSVTEDEIEDEAEDVTEDETENQTEDEGGTWNMQCDCKWNEQFWEKNFLEELIDFYLELEINDENWWRCLCDIKDNLWEVIHKRKEFLDYYDKKVYEYEQLLIYFIYRHFMKARNDDALFEKVIFALISTNMIQVLDIYEWMTKGEVTPAAQINICKLYSKEIEYDEENVERLSYYLSEKQ